MRLLLGLAGLATASAIGSAMLPSILPRADAASVDAATVDTAAGGAPAAPVRHVTRYVVLAPGQTAPPDAPVIVQPSPSPRVHVVTQTRQSGRS